MSRTVMKLGQADPRRSGGYGLELRDVAAEARQIVERARAQAAQIVAEARVQAASERGALEEAYRQRGLIEGRGAGRGEALAEARSRFTEEQHSLQSALQDLLDQLGRRSEELYLAARRDVIVLATAIASRIVQGLTEEDAVASQAAVDAAAEALERVAAATTAVVRAHPADTAALARFCEPLSRQLESGRLVRIVEDESQARGGVQVETRDGVVDATVGARLARIADELVGSWRTRQKELSLT